MWRPAICESFSHPSCSFKLASIWCGLNRRHHPRVLLQDDTAFCGACADEQAPLLMFTRLMQYRAEATSVEGFVQQIACCYLRYGYWFYVCGRIPIGKDPKAIDAKLIEKYGIGVSESTRARRKQSGYANLQYIRHDRFFVLLATKGVHPFFEEESQSIRDIRRIPIRYAGYSISYRRGGMTRSGSSDPKWHAHVRMDRRQYLDLRACLTEWANTASSESLAKTLSELPVAAYAPVRRQLLNLLRRVNSVLKTRGKSLIDASALPLQRKVVRPFD